MSTSTGTSARRRATHGASVSPDGRAFAHIVDDGGYPRAVQRYLDGTRVSTSRYVTLPVAGPITAVRHSPDGRWLACQVSPEGLGRTQVWVVTTDPADDAAWRVDDSRDGAAELVGWDGTRVLVTAGRADGLGESRHVDPATGEADVIDARPEGRLVDAWAGVAVIRVGPRGDRSLRLLWGGEDTALLPHDPGSVSDVAVVLDDHGPRTMASRHARGRRLLPFTAHGTDAREGYVDIVVRSDVESPRPRLLRVIVTDRGASYRVLAEREDADLDTVEVSRDGRRAVLLWNVGGGRSELQVLELSDGSLHDPLPLPGLVASEPSISADGGLLALTVESPGRDRSVEIVDLRTSLWLPEPSLDADAWVDVDEAPCRPDAVLPSLERFRARDGLELTGWLYRSGEAREAGPVVIHLHGGPEGQERPGYSHLFPTLLDAGLSVFAPNVRGSGGFGRAFSHADDVGLRQGSIDDVADAAHHLVASGIADPAAIAVAGWSYGGYLTMATLAFHPHLAVCGVAVSGMSDFGTFHATTEPWISRAARSKYGDPARDAALLARFSPWRNARAVTAPLLLVHGANDTNVPPSESRQMADAVRTARGPGAARLVVLEGEGHEIVRTENKRRLAELVRDTVLDALATGRRGVVPAGG